MADWVCRLKVKTELMISTNIVTANSHDWNLRETGVSSLFMRRKGFFHSLQRICNATALAAMPRAVKTIIGTEQVLTT